MSIEINGGGLTIDKLVQIARNNEKIELGSNSIEKIKA